MTIMTVERVQVRCILVYGEGAEAVAQLATPWHQGRAPLLVAASVIAAQAGLPAGELPGRHFWATGDAGGLDGFELVNDPRQ
ncbi:hypothetical protein NONI108955_01505 [Nocardia ninae]|uniref:Uncharacterized protein n=1 Tax=Nocardia ninae NBRC 108245 TaxID=1210091 RepID=A0A511MDN3_9NOCA|nr:hypothetical protein [Nocardia ninae]GEM38257.1 hypothetical protein NN4_27760 [Nocardia ninae NBRC 108245]